MSKDLQDKILLLYDTILGKFSFFRQFLKVLLDFYDKLSELELKLQTYKSENENLVNEIKDLKDKIQEMNKPNKEDSKNFSKARATQIMSDMYNASLN